jgi:hypothetical protein
MLLSLSKIKKIEYMSIKPRVKAAVIDFLKSEVTPGANVSWKVIDEAYAAECRLFGEHFKKMTKSEIHDYSKFVKWLQDTDMFKSDLSVEDLYDAYEFLEFDLPVQLHDDEDEFDF